uniref:RNA-directed DNA polymerase n=1 Tax=Strongyloides stercoralis TaxID=6248 RepID=A0A913I019_STRER
MMHIAHDNHGHPEVERTLKLLKGSVYREGMNKEIASYIRLCNDCQLRKRNKKNFYLLNETPIPDTPFDIVGTDVKGDPKVVHPLAIIEGKYIIQFIDYLTGFWVLEIISDQRAETIYKVFIRQIVAVFGISRIMVSDSHKSYLQGEFANMIKEMGCELLPCMPGHKNGNSVAERSFNTLRNILSLMRGSTGDLEIGVRMAMFCYNSTPQVNHKKSSYEWVFGKIPRIGLPNIDMSIINQNRQVFDLSEAINIGWNICKEEVIKKRQKHRDWKNIDRHAETKYKVGDIVKVENQAYLRDREQQRYLGPYVVCKIADEIKRNYL